MSTVGNRHLVELELEMRPERNQELHRPLRPELTGLWQGGGTIPPSMPSIAGNSTAEACSSWHEARKPLRTPLAVLRIHHAH